MKYKMKCHQRRRPGSNAYNSSSLWIKTCLFMQVDSLDKMRFTIIYLLRRLKLVLHYGPRFASCYIKIWLLVTIWMTSPVTLLVQMLASITPVIPSFLFTFLFTPCFLFVLEDLLTIHLSFVVFSSPKYLRYFNILFHLFLLAHSRCIPFRSDIGPLLLSGQVLAGCINSLLISE